MKALTILAILLFSVALISIQSVPLDASAQGKKVPERFVLAKEAKLGAVAFNHLKHATEKLSADGTQVLACTECHHTAQPAAEVAKNPQLKTAWPADRTTTLTAELLEKDASVTVNLCTDCHARANTKPKLLPEIPSLNLPGGAMVLTNQQASHVNCAGCHDVAMTARPNLSPAPPTSKKCTACHKKTVA